MTSIDVMESTIDATSLDEEQLTAWMGAINDLRLVLGTRLDVSEDDEPPPDPGDPAAALHEIYHYLGVLLEAVIDALES
jgi:hypothetical protein